MLSKFRLLRMILPVIEFIEFRVLHIDDSPQRIAGGVFAGIMVAYTPLIGLHIAMGLLVSTIFRVNKFATISFVWISNVFTIVPIYYPSYIIGRAVLNVFTPKAAMSRDEIFGYFKSIVMDMLTNSIFTRQFWDNFIYLFTRIGAELFIGGIVVGLPVATMAYYLTVEIVIRHRKKMQRRKFRRKLRLSARKRKMKQASGD